ncbi:MAG: hypothetical protein AUG04_06380 [Deltaproteobacteria bacterium 13_1_20CM_2_69_21]|nr:MAG: hypothetical protein AUG04_06380 [Deltaproteobacteria bacterium 13_1_20CM_2_69_21]
MAKKRLPPIEVGYQAFAKGSEEEFGAVRQVRPQDLVVYIEDAGDTIIPIAAVTDVVEGKVIIDIQRLDETVRRAIENAHRDEDFP